VRGIDTGGVSEAGNGRRRGWNTLLIFNDLMVWQGFRGSGGNNIYTLCSRTIC
jgi:hypothetical protein